MTKPHPPEQITTVVRCPNAGCGAPCSVAAGLTGKQVRCPRCGKPFVVPGTPRSPKPQPDEPEAIGRYRLREPIGAGAFGTVYRAHDPQLDREVALKVLKPSALASAKAVERFQREAKAAARMMHPNIVPVHDAGQHDGRFYIASALIAGHSLSDLIPEGGMEAGPAVRLVLQLLDALAYAHGQNVLHRDVKPGNVLVTEGGHLYLTDFGLAGWVEPGQTRVTQLGTVIGTPSYMAPEQAAGDTPNVGPAADVYSAGVVLYQLLTGRVPFEGPVSHVLYNVLNREPEPASSLRRDLDRRLEAICVKAMAKRKADRYADATTFATALRRWTGSQTLTVGPPSVRSTPARRPTRETVVITSTVSHEPQPALVANVPTLVPLVTAAKPVRTPRGEVAGRRAVATIIGIVIAVIGVVIGGAFALLRQPPDSPLPQQNAKQPIASSFP